ncbi:hypothetical protein C0Q70_09693 [Pomacea canaliculata]|uniref:Uncharacterized protein n=1 Tax=Pomacea canaliculata TaxID=400727 RepID=A0A2T7PAI1_POMCA|nr:hypothetical protein C0Q70_09693 [Pomacea canaliculata]
MILAIPALATHYRSQAKRVSFLAVSANIDTATGNNQAPCGEASARDQGIAANPPSTSPSPTVQEYVHDVVTTPRLAIPTIHSSIHQTIKQRDDGDNVKKTLNDDDNNQDCAAVSRSTCVMFGKSCDRRQECGHGRSDKTAPWLLFDKPPAGPGGNPPKSQANPSDRRKREEIGEKKVPKKNETPKTNDSEVRQLPN